MISVRHIVKLPLLACGLALLLMTGCAGGPPPRVMPVPTVPGAMPAYGGYPGAQYCDKSRDGKDVACGGAATYCEQSRDGTMVTCGAMATYCEKSRDGKQVACGGRANYCEKSADGKRTACGGMQY
jgi:hypothetical protein